MRKKAYLALSLALFCLCAAYSAHAQAVSATTEEVEKPFAIGAGISGYTPGHWPGRLYGGTLWLDYTPTWMPSLLQGIGIEAEARDLNYGRPSSQPNLRQDVVEGGVIYSWRHYRNLRPYGKFLAGYGNADYGARVRSHDSRTITSLGGGVEVRAVRCVWVRADYEYQFWPDFFKHPYTTQPAGQLNPEGFTLGVLYHFNRLHFR